MKTRIRTDLHAPQPHIGPLLSSYQDGTASPDEQDLTERHLLECEVCRDFFASLQQVREVISELPGSGNYDQAEYQKVMARTLYKDYQKKLKKVAKAQNIWRKRLPKTKMEKLPDSFTKQSDLQNAAQEEIIQ